MMCTQASLLCVSAALAFIAVTGRTTTLTLYAATMLLALFNSLESPSRQAIVANLVPREDLAPAMALTNTQRYIATIAGPSIAGVVLGFLGSAICYTVDAVSWLIMICALLLIRTRSQERGGWRTVTLRSLGDGFHFVWGHAVIFPLLMMDFGVNFFGSVRSLFPIFARDILAVGPKGMGILYAASAAGSLLGAAAFSSVGEVRRAGRWILAGVTVYGVCIVLFAASHAFLISVLLLVGSGVGDIISSILRGTINQLATPDSLRGRMSAINTLFTNSGPQLGQFEAGFLAAFIGAQFSAMTGGLIILLIVAVLVLRFPHVRDFELSENARAELTG
jgi:MFS family permease